MASTLELVKVNAGSVIARQGDDADRIFILQSGELSARLAPESIRKDDKKLIAEPSSEVWDQEATIIATESVMAGHYIESIVCEKTSDVLVLPINRVGLIKQFATSPKTALSFGRSLARKVMNANKNLTNAQRAVAKLEQELERIYTSYYDMVKSMSADAEGDDLLEGPLRKAKGTKTFTTGQRIAGDDDEGAVSASRTVESYEMTGKQHKLKKGEALCRAGDPGNSMFIVTKGKLAVVINGNKVGEIGNGETVGEIAVLLGDSKQARTADLIAEENTIVAIIPGDQFEKLAMMQPAMLLSLLSTLTKRIEANYAVVSDREGREKKSILRYLGKPDVNVEKDYRDLAKDLEKLIEEYDYPLYREMDLLERGADKIVTLKEKYAAWLPEEVLAATV